MFQDIKHIKYSNINGDLESIQPFEEVKIKTSIGTIIPVYNVEDMGRKKLTPIKFDLDGNIKSLQLQDVKKIKTSIGMFLTEFITFYASGEMCRLFQLNGKLSGFWSEQNEYDLAKTIKISTPIGDIIGKPIYIHFYKSGELKSITFWPKERVSVQGEYGLFEIKTGISFHPCGSLKSYEPVEPIIVHTALGNIEAFDPDPVGINGERNSLEFNTSGDILRLSTIKSQVMVIDDDGNSEIFAPVEIISRCNDELFVIQPLNIEFSDDEVIFRYGFKIAGKASRNLVFVLQEFSPQNQLASVGCCSE
ncbi:MAG: hypothetical protein OCD02_05070 [Spirochaetaceae bacterium]